eukprot:307678-Rhodomonas_salina.1
MTEAHARYLSTAQRTQYRTSHCMYGSTVPAIGCYGLDIARHLQYRPRHSTLPQYRASHRICQY